VNQTEVGCVFLTTFDGKGNSRGSQTCMMDGVLKTETTTGTNTVNPDGSGSASSANGTQWAFALNSVGAGQAKGTQCLATELNGHSLGNFSLTGTALKQCRRPASWLFVSKKGNSGLESASSSRPRRSLSGGFSFASRGR
jgi:hypothetical protein